MSRAHRGTKILDPTSSKYGARPGGVYDAGPGIGAALQDAVAAGGGTVLCDPGQYLIGTPQTIVVPSGTHSYISLEGPGWGDVEFEAGYAGSTPMFTFISDDIVSPDYGNFVRVARIVFEGSQQAVTACRFEFIRHVQYESNGHGHFVENGGADPTGEGVVKFHASEWAQAWGNQFWDAPDGESHQMVLTSAVFGSTFQNNIFGPRIANCVYQGPDAQGCLWQGNHFAFHTQGYSMLIDGGFKLNIANNYIYPFQGAFGGALPPQPSQKGVIVQNNAFDVLLTGNFFEDVTYDAALVLKDGCTKVWAKNNVFHETADLHPSPPLAVGQLRVESDVGQDCLIDGNTFADSKTDYHIHIEDIGSTRLKVYNNSFMDAPTGSGPALRLDQPTNPNILLANNNGP